MFHLLRPKRIARAEELTKNKPMYLAIYVNWF